MLKQYKTVKGYGEQEIVINKSRFIAYVNRAECEEAALEFIESIKKKHWDATHNCSAYVIGEHDQHQKANDDGEPSGTAGKPILEVIKKKELKDTVVVITRYFGGIKLGAGGLIRAYGQSTSEGLEAAGIVQRIRHTEMHVTVDYTLLGKIENELRKQNYIVGEIHYLENVTIPVFVPVDNRETFIRWMTDLTNDQAQIKENGSMYIEVNV